jgi:cytolysin (calcineurin-like family phosphatase)
MHETRLAGAILILAACGPAAVNVAAATVALPANAYNFQTLTGSGSCVDVSGAGSTDGTRIQQWTCSPSAAQSFWVQAAGAGIARVVNTPTGKCLDVAGSGTSDGTSVQLWTCNGSAAQDFKIEDAGSGRVVLRNVNSNKCVEVAGASTAAGAALQISTCSTSNGQLFRPVALAALDLTFYVVSDTHADPPESYDLRAMARAINAVSQSGVWPSTIGGAATGFKGGRIGPPRGVVFTGDLMGWGVTPTEMLTFRRYFERGRTSESIWYAAYAGLGNHDVDDADRAPDLAAQYRDQAWAYVDSRYKGSAAPVPVTRFDAASHAYSWDFGGAHFVQVHRFAGDTGHGLASSLPFLSADLKDNASDGRPVFVFHHYGMDAFGTQDRWWTAAQRTAYRNALNGANVAAIFAGHSHAAMQYTWQGERVFQVNNAKAENGTGNNDGNGSFAIVRLTDQKLEVVTCRWLDDTGRYEMIGPYYAGPARP